MARIDKHLVEWVKEGFLSEEQASRIKAFEAERPTGNWLVYGFLALGASAIGIGVISLVAANWSDLPEMVKLGSAFLLLMGLAAGVYVNQGEEREIAREIFLLLFIFLCMATIGLISQLFHTGGRLTSALLFWCAITLPAATLSGKGFVPKLWATVALWSFVFWYATSVWWLIPLPEESRWSSVMYAVPLFSLLVAMLLQGVDRGAGFADAFSLWVPWTALTALFTADIKTAEHSGVFMTDAGSLMPGFALGMVLLLLLARHSVPGQRLPFMGGLLLYVIGLPFAFMAPVPGLVGAALSLLILFAGVVAFALLGRTRMANFFILLMGMRFMILYFQAFGGLALTGFGMIVSGGVVLGLILWWQKNRKRINRWLLEVAA